jgi:hypothetical protein
MSSSTAPQRVTRSQTRQSSVEDSGLPAKETQKEASQQTVPTKPTQELGKRPFEAVNDPIDRREEAAAGSKKDIRAAKKKSTIPIPSLVLLRPLFSEMFCKKVNKQTRTNQMFPYNNNKHHLKPRHKIHTHLMQLRRKMLKTE